METVSTLAKVAIEQLLNVHALACMARASGNKEHMSQAAAWLPHIEYTIATMRRELVAEPKICSETSRGPLGLD